jgi:DNA-directed RNA polymerase subunit F
MKNGEIVEMKPISITEVKSILKERQQEKELNYEQDVTFKFVEKFAKLKEKEVETLLKAFNDVEFLKNNIELKYQIINALPTSVDQFKLFVPKDTTVSDEECNKIVDLLKKFEGKN